MDWLREPVWATGVLGWVYALLTGLLALLSAQFLYDKARWLGKDDPEKAITWGFRAQLVVVLGILLILLSVAAMPLLLTMRILLLAAAIIGGLMVLSNMKYKLEAGGRPSSGVMRR